MEIVVNGERRVVAADGFEQLLELLREELDLTGTKPGCESRSCGAW